MKKYKDFLGNDLTNNPVTAWKVQNCSNILCFMSDNDYCEDCVYHLTDDERVEIGWGDP